MRYKNSDRNVELVICNDLLHSVYNRCMANYPRETGGMLAGRYSQDKRTAFIERIVIPSRESSSATEYERSTEGMEAEWKELASQEIFYLGEWHSHPNGNSSFSFKDLTAMRRIAEEDGVMIENPILLIVGLNKWDIKSHTAYIYSDNELFKYKEMIDFKELFSGLQCEMQESLNINRRCIPHMGSMGDASETHWIKFLSAYLPDKYKVDKAMVIDSEGSVSQQIDIVIYDALYTPFIFNHDGFKYIPAEGVYAVFEVKQDINGNIKYAAEKIESVRKLKRTSMPMIASGKKHEERSLSKIIGGILTTDCSYVNTATIEKQLKSLKGFQTIDLGCSVSYGSFYVDYEGEDRIKTEDRGFEPYEKFYQERIVQEIHFNKNEHSLFTFFLQLVHYLKQIGTVPAINVNAYLKAVDEEIDLTF